MKGRDELLHEVECLDIECSNVSTKEFLMDLLMMHYREHNPDNYTQTMLPQLPVMLARNVKDLKNGELDRILESGNWIAEEKLDGVRAKLHLGNNGNRIDSRHRSDITYEYVEKTDCLPHLRDMRTRFAGTVLDGELIMPQAVVYGKTCTDSSLTATTATVNSKPGRAIEIQEGFGYCHFYPFDILFYCGEDVRNKEYNKRYDILCDVRYHLHKSGHSRGCIKTPVRCICSSSIPNFYKKLIKGDSEGIMLKHVDWPYESGKRSKGLYKWKKQFDLDCFITGFVPGEGEFSGVIGALLVSIHTENGAQEVGAVQPGSLTFRRSISEVDGSLCDAMYGKVMEVTYLCKTKNDRLRHAVLSRWRPDKNMYDCKGEL